MMPYQKRNYRKRNYRGARNKRRRPGGVQGYFTPRNDLTYGQMFTKVWKDVGYLKGLVNTEYKFVDSELALTPSTTPSLTLLNGIARGDTVSEREGRMTRIKSVQLRFTSSVNASATASVLRLILFIDKGPEGSAPTATDVVSGINGLRNLDERKNIVILKDWYYHLVPGQSNHRKEIHYYKKLDMKTLFNGNNTGAVTDVEANSLYFYAQSSESTNTPSISGHARVRYIDN